MPAPYVRPLTAAATSSACPLSPLLFPFQVTIALAVQGTNTSKVQVTLDDPLTAIDPQGSNLTWFDHATLVNVTANALGNIAFPVRAVRLVMTAYTSGQATMTVLQAGL